MDVVDMVLLRRGWFMPSFNSSSYWLVGVRSHTHTHTFATSHGTSHTHIYRHRGLIAYVAILYIYILGVDSRVAVVLLHLCWWKSTRALLHQTWTPCMLVTHTHTHTLSGALKVLLKALIYTRRAEHAMLQYSRGRFGASTVFGLKIDTLWILVARVWPCRVVGSSSSNTVPRLVVFVVLPCVVFVCVCKFYSQNVAIAIQVRGS